MPRRPRQNETIEDLNIWSAYTDLMSNTLMILVIFFLLATLKPTLEKIFNQNEKPTEAPPIIVIQNTGAYQFGSGSADLPPPLISYIFNKLVNQIEQNAKTYQIDVVEVIGHTDGQSNSGSASNLDQFLEQAAQGNINAGSLRPGSNADLGLMRSLAVVRILQQIQQKKGRLQGLTFRAYSAAQLISPSGKIAEINRTADPTRRRIEIRFTRLGKVTNVQ
ncbi:MAG: hypothetical protein WBB28_23750 [Crinalium sp.]